jgi:cold shock CspA family protein
MHATHAADRPLEQRTVATVIWYNTTKNCGYAQSADLERHIFLPGATLRKAEINGLAKGDVIELSVQATNRGPTATAIHAHRLCPERESTVALGKIKWYSAEKAYGFCTIEDGVDVFLHRDAVKKSSVDETALVAETPVELCAWKTDRGLNAQWIRLLPIEPAA